MLRIIEGDVEAPEGGGEGEDGERLGHGRGYVVGGEGTEAREEEGNFAGAVVHHAASEVGDDETAGDVDDELYEHDRGVVFAAEEEETEGEESGIAGEADPGRLRIAAGMGEAVDAVVDPVLGDVAIDIGVAGDVGELEDEEQAEGDGEQRRRAGRATSRRGRIGAREQYTGFKIIVNAWDSGTAKGFFREVGFKKIETALKR